MEGFAKADFVAAGPGPLGELSKRAGELLKAAKQNITVVEATSGGLINAALQAYPGASSYITCGAVTYSPKLAVSVLGADLSTNPRPADGAAYRESKNVWTKTVAQRQLGAVGATWSICESGACGPTFRYEDVTTGFTSIFVSGPVSKGIMVESPHNDREANMWSFCKMALDLLADCLEEAAKLAPAGPVEAPPVLIAKPDRYGGVEVEVSSASAGVPLQRFTAELRDCLAAWQKEDKGGIWLQLPSACAGFAGAAVGEGFKFNHAKPEYVMLTQWLKASPCPLPLYAFTRIGVGGIVLNQKDEVLLVQEKISPIAKFQDIWKMPGGLADPGEDLVDTVMREVREETGVTAILEGVVSMRHGHGFPHGQSDMYFLVKLRATEDKITLDEHELKDAQWMSREKIKSIVADPGDAVFAGKTTPNNWKMICNALDGVAIVYDMIPNSMTGKPNYLYKAPPPEAASQK